MQISYGLDLVYKVSKLTKALNVSQFFQNNLKLAFLNHINGTGVYTLSYPVHTSQT